MEEFQKAVKTCFSKYADFNGRAARPEFWWFFLLQFVAYLVSSMVHGLLYLLVFLALLLPGIAVGARRMHDIGKSGWILLLGLIPLVGFILLYFAAQPGQPESNQYGPPPTPTADPALAPGQQ
jgi:uncharacterized membrane protein YhaH (DUF805 family)